MQKTFGDIREDSKYMKIKLKDTRKEEKVLIRNISIDYKKKSQYIPSSIIMEHTWSKQCMI